MVQRSPTHSFAATSRGRFTPTGDLLSGSFLAPSTQNHSPTRAERILRGPSLARRITHDPFGRDRAAGSPSPSFLWA
ncbi:hypothetical protein BJV78DRAFT_1247345 [Lactifluus subvellereus]|nr:hypothetical protein BJV78DRAFT_1247345 [Lactifluus subvellereus]